MDAVMRYLGCIILVILVNFSEGREAEGRISCIAEGEEPDMTTPFSCRIVKNWDVCGKIKEPKRQFQVTLFHPNNETYLFVEFRLNYKGNTNTVFATSFINNTWDDQVEGKWYEDIEENKFCVYIVPTAAGMEIWLGIVDGQGGKVLVYPYKGNSMHSLGVYGDIDLDFVGLSQYGDKLLVDTDGQTQKERCSEKEKRSKGEEDGEEEEDDD